LKAARIVNGLVAEVTNIPEGFELSDMFHADAGFVACPDDVTEGMTCNAGVFGPAPEMVIYTPVPATISDRQFYQQLAVAGIITEDEALAAVQTGAIPDALAEIIDGMPSEKKFGAKMMVGGAVSFERDHPLTKEIATAFGMQSNAVDEFFRDAARL
jgi:hypothetical protein